MALSDFNGTYEVEATSGTPFGSYSTVEIQQVDEANATVRITPYQVDYEGLDTESRTAFNATYVEDQDCLEINLETDTSKAHSMYISRYFDATEDYRTIYSTVRLKLQDQQGPVRHAPVWTAKMLADPAVDEAGKAPSQLQSDPSDKAATQLLDAADFEGDYVVRSSANAQFGTFARLRVGPSTDGTSVLTILDFEEEPQSQTTVAFDPDSCSMMGTLAEGIVGPDGKTISAIVSLSLAMPGDASDPTQKRLLYGTVIIGDPEQAGTFVGEDEGG